MPPGLHDLIRQAASRPQVFEAFFATTPAVDEPAEVIIPSFDRRYRWGPAYWMPFHDGTNALTPTRGKRCVVAIAEPDETIWVLGWWPYA